VAAIVNGQAQFFGGLFVFDAAATGWQRPALMNGANSAL
jgi:hypothetical protein